MAENSGVVFLGQNKVEVQSIDFPKLQNPAGKKINHGVILKVVSTNICGSDQHMVRGRTTAPTGMVLGHEITGEIIEAVTCPRFSPIHNWSLCWVGGCGWRRKAGHGPPSFEGKFELLGRAVVQRAVGPLAVVLLAPGCQSTPDIIQRAEQLALRHSSRRRPWKLSTWPFCIGRPGWMGTRPTFQFSDKPASAAK